METPLLCESEAFPRITPSFFFEKRGCCSAPFSSGSPPEPGLARYSAEKDIRFSEPFFFFFGKKIVILSFSKFLRASYWRLSSNSRRRLAPSSFRSFSFR